MTNRFKGWYFKHQKGGRTLALIPGISAGGAFIQIITENASYKVDYDISLFRDGRDIIVGSSVFSKHGIDVNIDANSVQLKGVLHYGPITPLGYNIMGPFAFLPMQCRHAVLSMGHTIEGSLSICGEKIDFTGGRGYIESDSGTSFPSRYIWMQCNDFQGDTSIMASAANIPLAGAEFLGCICAIRHEEKNYRLATYNGVKIEKLAPDCIVLKKGRICFEAEVFGSAGHSLYAPDMGNMTRIIRESVACSAHFILTDGQRRIFDLESKGTSLEYVQ